METTHILGHIVDYEDTNEHRLVIKHLRRMEDQHNPELEEWFSKARSKGSPKITDVDGLESKKRFTLKMDSNSGRFSIAKYESKGLFG